MNLPRALILLFGMVFSAQTSFAAMERREPFAERAIARIHEPQLQNPTIPPPPARPEPHDPMVRAANMVIIGSILSAAGGAGGIATLAAMSRGDGFAGDNALLIITSILFVVGVSLVYAGWSIRKQLSGRSSKNEPVEL